MFSWADGSMFLQSAFHFPVPYWIRQRNRAMGCYPHHGTETGSRSVWINLLAKEEHPAALGVADQENKGVNRAERSGGWARTTAMILRPTPFAAAASVLASLTSTIALWTIARYEANRIHQGHPCPWDQHPVWLTRWCYRQCPRELCQPWPSCQLRPPIQRACAYGG